MEIPGLSNNTTEILKQKKIISWAPVDKATDESSGQTTLGFKILFEFLDFILRKICGFPNIFSRGLYQNPYLCCRPSRHDWKIVDWDINPHTNKTKPMLSILCKMAVDQELRLLAEP